VAPFFYSVFNYFFLEQHELPDFLAEAEQELPSVFAAEAADFEEQEDLPSLESQQEDFFFFFFFLSSSFFFTTTVVSFAAYTLLTATPVKRSNDRASAMFFIIIRFITS
jgi:hypothetical protein